MLTALTMRDARQLARLVLLTLPLLLGLAACDSDDNDSDAGADGCKESDCAGKPVPAIGCAEGPTVVVCERNSDGICQPEVRCGDEDGGGANGEQNGAGANNNGASNGANGASNGTNGASNGASEDGGGAQTGGSNASTGGQDCGGFAGTACSGKTFCNVEVEAGGTGCKGISDASGKCEPIPSACTVEYAPVCGCDSHSYVSTCEAHANGVSVAHKELCTAEECLAIGGRIESSDGATSPKCKAGEDSFNLPGREVSLCCFKK